MKRFMGIVAAALLAACGKRTEGAHAARTYKAGDTLTIAVIAKSSNNPVFLAARTGAEAAAREAKDKYHVTVKIAWMTPPEEDGQVQAQRIQQAVNDGVDAILVSCSDAGKVTGAINDAVDRGVPVMTFDSDAPASKRFSFYGMDDAATGRLLMQDLAPLLPDGGKIAVLAGNQNAPNLQRRVAGVREEAAKHAGIQIVGVFNHIETPQDAAAEVIRVDNAYPDIKGWVFVGGWPLFTQTLLSDLDPAKLKIVSVDALPAQLAYVDRGIAPVLLAQPVYLWGYVSTNTILDKLVGGKPVPAVVPMDVVRVSKDNLGAWARQLRDWGFTDVPAEYLNRQ